MSTKLELLKLSKRALIKKCKAINVKTHGTKSDMVERILNSTNSTKQKRLKASKKKTKTNNNTKDITSKESVIFDAEQHYKDIENEINKKTCFHLFKIVPKIQGNKHKISEIYPLDDIIFSTLINFLSIYTLCNLISAFPNYRVLYKNAKMIGEAIDTANNIQYDGVHGMIVNLTKSHEDNVLNHLKGKCKMDKISALNDKTMLEFLIKNYYEDGYEREREIIKMDNFKYNEQYNYYDKKILKFNKTDIINIDELLILFVVLRKTKCCKIIAKDDEIENVVKRIKNRMDTLSWTDIAKIVEEEKNSEIPFLKYNDNDMLYGVEYMECIYFVYLFLEVILEFDGDKKTIYSTLSHFDFKGTDYEWDFAHGWTLFFESNNQIYKIKFRSTFGGY